MLHPLHYDNEASYTKILRARGDWTRFAAGKPTQAPYGGNPRALLAKVLTQIPPPVQLLQKVARPSFHTFHATLCGKANVMGGG